VTYEIVPATEWHVRLMAPHVRQADIDELWASSLQLPLEVMKRGLEVSSECWVALADGVPFCVFGVVPGSLLGGAGVPWAVGTDQITKHARFFLQGSKPLVRRWLETFPVLMNLVDARNTVAIRWLKWVGFQFNPPAPAGPLGMDFHLFQIWRAHVQ